MDKPPFDDVFERTLELPRYVGHTLSRIQSISVNEFVRSTSFRFFHIQRLAVVVIFGSVVIWSLDRNIVKVAAVENVPSWNMSSNHLVQLYDLFGPDIHLQSNLPIIPAEPASDALPGKILIDIYRATTPQVLNTLGAVPDGRISRDTLERNSNVAILLLNSLDSMIEVAQNNGFEMQLINQGADVVLANGKVWLVPNLRTSEGLIIPYETSVQSSTYLYRDRDGSFSQYTIGFMILESDDGSQVRVVPAEMYVKENGNTLPVGIFEIFPAEDNDNVSPVETLARSAMVMSASSVLDIQGNIVDQISRGTNVLALGANQDSTKFDDQSGSYIRVLYERGVGYIDVLILDITPTPGEESFVDATPTKEPQPIDATPLVPGLVFGLVPPNDEILSEIHGVNGFLNATQGRSIQFEQVRIPGNFDGEITYVPGSNNAVGTVSVDAWINGQWEAIQVVVVSNEDKVCGGSGIFLVTSIDDTSRNFRQANRSQLLSEIFIPGRSILIAQVNDDLSQRCPILEQQIEDGKALHPSQIFYSSSN